MGSRFLAGWIVFILSFLLGPLVFVIFKGLQRAGFVGLLDKPEVLSAFFQSFLLAILSGVISTFIGTCTAMALPKFGKKTKRLVNLALVFPMVLPEIAIGLCLLVWFVQVNVPLGWGTLIAGHVALCLGYATFVMKARVETLEESLIEAARDLGANRWQVFRHAVLPQLMPGLVSSFILCFALSLDDFLISTFVKSFDVQLLPLQIFSMIRIKVGPEIYSLSLILFCISALGVVLSHLWIKKRNQLKSV
jgi:spermidine/putrescine transport system permease protein